MVVTFTKLVDGRVIYFALDDFNNVYKGYTVEELKANYKTGEDYARARMYNQYVYNPPPVTTPHIYSLSNREARRKRYEKNEEGGDLHFLSRRRRATSHKFGGDAKRLSRKSPFSPYEEKANYGNYSEEEEERKKWKRGNDYSLLFDGDDVEEKGVVDNKARVLPPKNKPYQSDDRDVAPPVRRAKHKKLRNVVRENIDTSPEILSVEQAANFSSN